MMQHLWPLSLLFLSIFACQSIDPQDSLVTNTPSAAAPRDTLEALLQQGIDQHAQHTLQDSLIHALSIGIYLDGRSYTLHYGELTRGKNDPPQDHTIYEIGSVTKTFTGTLAAKAVVEGKLRLEDDIRRYLPRTYPNLAFEGHPIRVQHLLTHTAGLPSTLVKMEGARSSADELAFNRTYLQLEEQQTKDSLFQGLAQLKLREKPGTSFNYSNLGSNLMGYLVERVYGKAFQDLVREEILTPQGLRDVHFHSSAAQQKRLAPGYLLHTAMPETKLAQLFWGAEGALKATTPDLMNYVRYQLTHDAIVQESHRKLYEIDTDYWIGYFWWVIQNQNHDLHYRHDGGISRGKTVLVIYPEQQIGISICTNQSSVLINNKLNELTYRLYATLKAHRSHNVRTE